MTRKRIILIAMLIALSILGSDTAQAAQKNRKASGKWIELFNGKGTTGWRQAGPGSFTIEGGALVSQGGMGMLFYEAKKFRDFTLEVEWKVAAQCNNSGIFVRFPEKSDDPWHAVNNGYEIQINDCDKKGLLYQTGSVYTFSPAKKVASKPAGEWNKYEITVVGQHYTVKLNGEIVNEYDGSRGREGYIGLQNHDPLAKVSFRRVRIKEIEPANGKP